MKTVLKVPLYLVIETEGKVDRNLLVSNVEEILFPVWVKAVKSKDIDFSSSNREKFSKAIGQKAKISLTPSLEIPTE